MEGGEPCGSCESCRESRLGPIELLDDYWFCHNMLFYGSRHLSSEAKASCSRNSIVMVEKNQQEELTSKAPDDPIEEKPKEVNVISSPADLRKLNDISDNQSLHRAPSLPSYAREVKVVNGEEGSNGARPQPRLQRSLTLDANSTIATHRGGQQFNKSYSSRLNIPRRPLRREMSGQLRAQSQRSRKSLSDLEEEEVQGFRDLGFTFNKEDISPSLVTMIPGLQEKRAADNEKVRRPYLSEAWLVQRSAPPQLNWDQRNSGLDVKEQLRIWAKNVASNVGQEC